MGNGQSAANKRASLVANAVANSAASSATATPELLISPPSVSATGLSLARYPSAASSQFSSIPESVQATLEAANNASTDPILIQPRLASNSSNTTIQSQLQSGTPADGALNGAAAGGLGLRSTRTLSSPVFAPTRLGRGGGNSLDIDDMIQRLLETGYSGKLSKGFCLKNVEITAVCQAAREVFLAQPSLIELSPPVKIVGDIHGQFHDLLRLFEMCGYPPSANFLFLGDYVDRGKQSLETILLLLCYKIKFPNNFFLLRGNHECANVTRVYGFYDECKRRCNVKIWKTFVSVFDTLPIAALVAGKIFCVHGGLSPSMTHMDDVRRLARPTEIPDYGLLNDLLWSDPSEHALEWEDNERGVSYCFGRRVVSEFLSRHDLDLVCRAHMVVEDGYEFFGDRQLVTVFSAPNYCGEFDNYGAVMGVSEELMCSFELLKPMDHPMGGHGAAYGGNMAQSGSSSNGIGGSGGGGPVVTGAAAVAAMMSNKKSLSSPPIHGAVPQSV